MSLHSLKYAVFPLILRIKYIHLNLVLKISDNLTSTYFPNLIFHITSISNQKGVLPTGLKPPSCPEPMTLPSGGGSKLAASPPFSSKRRKHGNFIFSCPLLITHSFVIFTFLFNISFFPLFLTSIKVIFSIFISQGDHGSCTYLAVWSVTNVLVFRLDVKVSFLFCESAILCPRLNHKHIVPYQCRSVSVTEDDPLAKRVCQVLLSLGSMTIGTLYLGIPERSTLPLLWMWRVLPGGLLRLGILRSQRPFF